MSWKERGRGYHHGNLREALIQAALDLIAEKGPTGFTFAEAARSAGVSPAAPYRHFRDRDELLSDVARRDGSQLVLFAGIDDARFKRQVVPGDTLILEAHLERAVRGIGRLRTKAMVGDELVCEAKLLAAIRDVPPKPPLPV